MKEKHIFDHLLKKYRANEMTEEEYRRFVELVDMDELEKEVALNEMARKDWGSSIDLLEQIRKEEQRFKRHMLLRRWVWSSAAAITLLCVAWFLWPQASSGNLVYQTGFGETQNIKLPDGSSVLLNANSSITWQGDWDQIRERHVVLKGEAYFDVNKVQGIPFDVEASDVLIHVLGTEFNVRSRESEAEVFLHKGKVDLQIGSELHAKVSMKPGDFVQYDRKSQKISVTDHERINNRAAWVDGMLEFENKKVGLILKEFEDLYGKQFKIENTALADRRMDFSLPYADWELVRKALEIAIGAEFVESRDTIIVK